MRRRAGAAPWWRLHRGAAGDKRASRGSDRGFATAEVAVTLPSLLLISLALIWVVGLVTAQLECVDAARAGARAVSRGESVTSSEAAALAAAPDGATVSITRSGDFIRVEVQVVVQPAGGLRGLVPAVTVRGVAHAIAEDAIGSAPHDVSIPVNGRTAMAGRDLVTPRAGPHRAGGGA